MLIRLLEARQHDTSAPVPVLVSAAAYDTRVGWQDWLDGTLVRQFSLSKQIAARLVRDGRILPVIDGLDEMDPAGKPERAQALVTARFGVTTALVGALTTGSLAGLGVGLSFGLGAGLAGGLAGGFAAGLTLAFAVAARAWTRYRVSVVIIAVRRRGPLRFSAFLDWAQQAGLLRVSGVAYQFRHRQPQDWLTSPPS